MSPSVDKRKKKRAKTPYVAPATGAMYEPVPESAKQLGVSNWFIWNLLRDGKLKAKKAGARTIVEVQSRIEYAASLPDATFAAPRGRKQTDNHTA